MSKEASRAPEDTYLPTYLRQTCKSSIWSEEDDDSYTLPDPEIPLVYSLHYGQQCHPEWGDGSVPAETADRQKKKEHEKSNLHAGENFLQKIESLNLDLLLTYEEVFGALPPPLSCKKPVQMDLKLKPEFVKMRVRRRPYPAPQEQVETIERQIQECIDAGLVEEYKKGNYPHHCSPCFLVAKPGWTALRLVVDYGEVNKKTQNHSGSIPNTENTMERIANCRYKTKMDKRSGFWQVHLTAAAQELLAFITPKGRVFKWMVMPFRVANAPALFQELMNKILYILRRRPLVQELISRGAEIKAHIDDVSLGTNTQEDHVLLLREFFIVCQENHLRIKLEKCEFMKEEMEYLGFDVGYGWWKPAASKMQPLHDMQIRDDPQKGLHDVRSFVGASNFYRRHIHNFTYSSAPLTDLIKKTTPWRWTAREEEYFQDLKKKIASSDCLGVPRPKGEIVVITDASDVGGRGMIYQWQELNPPELNHCHYRTSGLNGDGCLRHDYPTSEWRLVPLGHWNWKWNQARSNYSTYDQELLAGMLVLSSQSRLLGSDPIVWLRDQEPVKSFQKGPPPEKAKLKRWWTYLLQFRLTVHHIPGIKNELSDYISRNNFDPLIGESSEALAKEAFQRMDVQLDLSMHTAGVLEGWSLTDYQSEYKEILQTPSTGLEPRVIDGHQ